MGFIQSGTTASFVWGFKISMRWVICQWWSTPPEICRLQSEDIECTCPVATETCDPRFVTEAHQYSRVGARTSTQLHHSLQQKSCSHSETLLLLEGILNVGLKPKKVTRHDDLKELLPCAAADPGSSPDLVQFMDSNEIGHVQTPSEAYKRHCPEFWWHIMRAWTR